MRRGIRSRFGAFIVGRCLRLSWDVKPYHPIHHLSWEWDKKRWESEGDGLIEDHV
jgi:hypothetical protein